jgi:hypothetical protein
MGCGDNPNQKIKPVVLNVKRRDPPSKGNGVFRLNSQFGVTKEKVLWSGALMWAFFILFKNVSAYKSLVYIIPFIRTLCLMMALWAIDNE